MVAIPVLLEAPEAQTQAERVATGGGRSAAIAATEAGDRLACTESRSFGGASGGDQDDAARSIAIQRRGRAAQDLDALDLVQVDRVNLGLAVRQGLRNAVDQDCHAANAERGLGTEAPQRDACVLREIPGILDEQARHLVKHLSQACRATPVAQGLTVNHRHRRRHIGQFQPAAGGLDFDWFELHRRRLRDRGRGQQQAKDG